jgi:hypothetical protein
MFKAYQIAAVRALPFCHSMACMQEDIFNLDSSEAWWAYHFAILGR